MCIDGASNTFSNTFALMVFLVESNIESFNICCQGPSPSSPKVQFAIFLRFRRKSEIIFSLDVNYIILCLMFMCLRVSMFPKKKQDYIQFGCQIHHPMHQDKFQSPCPLTSSRIDGVANVNFAQIGEDHLIDWQLA